MPGPWPNTGLSHHHVEAGLPHVVAVDGCSRRSRVSRRAEPRRGTSEDEREPRGESGQAQRGARRSASAASAPSRSGPEPGVARLRDDERPGVDRQREACGRQHGAARASWRPRERHGRAPDRASASTKRRVASTPCRGAAAKATAVDAQEHAPRAARSRRCAAAVARSGRRGALRPASRSAIVTPAAGHVVAEEPGRAPRRACRSRARSAAASIRPRLGQPAQERGRQHALALGFGSAACRRQVEEREQHELLRLLVRDRGLRGERRRRAASRPRARAAGRRAACAEATRGA